MLAGLGQAMRCAEGYGCQREVRYVPRVGNTLRNRRRSQSRRARNGKSQYRGKAQATA